MPAWAPPLFCHKFQCGNDKHPSSRLRSDPSPSVHLSPLGPLAWKCGGSAEGATYFVAQRRCRWLISPKRFWAGAPLGPRKTAMRFLGREESGKEPPAFRHKGNVFAPVDSMRTVCVILGGSRSRVARSVSEN